MRPGSAVVGGRRRRIARTDSDRNRLKGRSLAEPRVCDIDNAGARLGSCGYEGCHGERLGYEIVEARGVCSRLLMQNRKGQARRILPPSARLGLLRRLRRRRQPATRRRSCC